MISSLPLFGFFCKTSATVNPVQPSQAVDYTLRQISFTALNSVLNRQLKNFFESHVFLRYLVSCFYLHLIDTERKNSLPKHVVVLLTLPTSLKGGHVLWSCLFVYR